MPDKDVRGGGFDARLRRLELWRAYEQAQFELRTQTLQEINKRLDSLGRDVKKIDQDVRNLETADEVVERVRKQVDKNRQDGLTRREKVVGIALALGMFALQLANTVRM